MEPTAATGLIALKQVQIAQAQETLATSEKSEMSLSESLRLDEAASASLGDGIGQALDTRA